MWIFPLVVVVLLVGLSFPLGRYLEWIIEGRYAPPPWLSWLERRIDTGPQNWKQYAFSLILFNTVLFAVGYVLLCLQPWAPPNPDGKSRSPLARSSIPLFPSRATPAFSITPANSTCRTSASWR